jgi:type IV pilus assembly protein PilW
VTPEAHAMTPTACSVHTAPSAARAAPPRAGCRGRRAAGGFSLIEFMVAVTLGLLLILGVTIFFVTTSRNFTEAQKSHRQIENGRYAMDLLSEELRHAGFYGEIASVGVVPSGAPPDPCATDLATLATALPIAIQGVDGAGTKPTCVPERIAGTDVLVVRRAHTIAIPAASAASGGYYVQVGFCATQLPSFQLAQSGFNLMTKACDSATPAPVRQFHTSIYFLSPCSLPSGATGTCAANPTAPAVPTLTRMDLGPGGFALVPLVEGIENMQLEYGLDSSGDGAADSFVVTPANTAAAWASVVAVRIHLLSRNVESTPGYADTKTYQLGTAVANAVTPGGAYARHAYVELVRLVNPSQRKETPL